MANSEQKTIRIFVSATEASADLHGAYIVQEIRKAAEGLGFAVEFAGIGGSHLRKANVELWENSSELSVMGVAEVLAKIFKIRKILNQVAAQANVWNPDICLVIDGPDFNMRIVKKVKPKYAYYLIPPKIWVWREKRIQLLKLFFRKLFVIFPFEGGFYQSRKMQVEYFGNPLIDELPLDLTKDQARASEQLDPDAFALCLMPGSRAAELHNHGGLFLDSAVQFFSETQSFISKKRVVLIALRPENREAFRKNWYQKISILEGQGIFVQFSANTQNALKASDLAIVKSGTSTLEAALMNCPHVVVYRVNLLTALVFRLIVRYRGPVALVNLVAAWDQKNPESYRSPHAKRVCPELLLSEATAERISKELVGLVPGTDARKAQLAAFESIAVQLGLQESPSRRIAQALLNDWIMAEKGSS